MPCAWGYFLFFFSFFFAFFPPILGHFCISRKGRGIGTFWRARRLKRQDAAVVLLFGRIRAWEKDVIYSLGTLPVHACIDFSGGWPAVDITIMGPKALDQGPKMHPSTCHTNRVRPPNACDACICGG